jgi:8-oxo-dGTP pyrophosphatase MutT (NUDIX family)
MYEQFRPIFTTSFFSLEEASVKKGSKGEPYYRLTGTDSVISCILDEDDKFIMVKQYRPSLGMFTIETPAGGIELSETPIEAAKREVHEEAGLCCPLISVGKNFMLMMNRTNIKHHLFFGMMPDKIHNFKPEPGVEVVRIPRIDLLKMAIEGEYIQLGAIGLLNLAGGILGINMWVDPYYIIENAFKNQIAK